MESLERQGQRVRTSPAVAWLLAVALIFVLSQSWASADRRKGPKPKRSLPPKSFSTETLELFSDNPLELVKGQRPAAGSGARPTPPTGGGPVETPGASSGGFAWSKVISTDAVTDEIKSYRLLVAENVSTPRAFKGGGNRQLRTHFGVLAVMFGIAAEHDNSSRFRKIAGGARDAFCRAAINAKATDSNTYKESKMRSEDLDELVRGGSVDFDTPKDEFLWSDLAERRGLMKRMSRGHAGKDGEEGGIKKWTANKGEFQRRRNEIKHEARVIAALAEVIQREKYEFYDDNDYLDFCRQLQKHALDVASAAEQDNLAEAQRAAGEMSKTCDACHEGFK